VELVEQEESNHQQLAQLLVLLVEHHLLALLLVLLVGQHNLRRLPTMVLKEESDLMETLI
jgi:hypothetical protein